MPFCSANNLFNEQFLTEPVIASGIADRITQYHSENILLPAEQQKIELLTLEKQLDALQNIHSNQASFWFIRGLNYKNIAAYYFENQNPQLVKSYIHKKNAAYKNAIDLSGTEDNKLSAPIFSTMKPGLPEDLKIQATKSEISLGGNGENDSYYWYLHWSNIDQLEKAGRKDEAKSAYKKMQEELQKSGMDMSIYTSLTEKIESETLKITSPAPESKNRSKSKPPETGSPESQKKPVPKKYDTKFIVISSIAVFSVLSLIAVIVYEIKRKGKVTRR